MKDDHFARLQSFAELLERAMNTEREREREELKDE